MTSPLLKNSLSLRHRSPSWVANSYKMAFQNNPLRFSRSGCQINAEGHRGATVVPFENWNPGRIILNEIQNRRKVSLKGECRNRYQEYKKRHTSRKGKEVVSTVQRVPRGEARTKARMDRPRLSRTLFAPYQACPYSVIVIVPSTKESAQHWRRPEVPVWS